MTDREPHYISHLTLDEARLLHGQESTHERHRAITDLLDKNYFYVEGSEGPYHSVASIEQHKFCLRLKGQCGGGFDLHIPLSPFKRIIKDYQIICETYVQSVQTADPAKVEAIDMGRRSLHNEGAELLELLLPGEIRTDFTTQRKLFTLIYVLQIR